MNKPKRTAGRPTKFSEELADRIVNELVEGKSLRTICDADDMPDRGTIVRWVVAHEDFAAKYARARETQADLMDDLILDVANACTSDTAAADRVKLSAYQWRAAKLAPKKYGDKLDLSGNMTVTHQLSQLTDEELAAEIEKAKAGQR